jgi:hypothetical protein
MIKVIEGYELKQSADIQPVFQKLRSYAMTFLLVLSISEA